MKITPEQLELIARRLDGESVELAPELELIASQIAADEAALGKGLDVAMPAGTLHRVAARALTRPTRPAQFVGRKWFKVGAAMAAAAAAVVVATVFFSLRPPEDQGNRNIAQVQSDSQKDQRVNELADEIARYQQIVEDDEPLVAEIGAEDALSHFFLGTPFPGVGSQSP